jgi:uroporphyrinogen decarboxylase
MMNQNRMKITPRQRVSRALRHESPDRPPLDLGSTLNTSITKIAYDRLKNHLGIALDTEPVFLSRSMQVVAVDDIVLERFQIDTRPVLAHPQDVAKPDLSPVDSYVDEWGVKFRAAKIDGKIFYYDPVEFPLAGMTTVRSIEKYDWPDPYDPGRTRGLRQRAKNLRENTAYALVGHMGDTSIFQNCFDLRGMEQFLIDLLIHKKMATALLEKVFEIQAIKMERYLDEVGPYLDVVCVGDDLAGQSGPLISIDLYREMIKPFHQAYFELIKRKTSARLHMHSCGSVAYFLNDLIEIGVDISNPVQVSAKGMNPETLKEKYGHKICFWGGIDSQHVLPHGTPQEVTREVRRVVNILGRDGGYVLGAVHNIQADVPPQNIVALYDAVV